MMWSDHKSATMTYFIIAFESSYSSQTTYFNSSSDTSKNKPVVTQSSKKDKQVAPKPWHLGRWYSSPIHRYIALHIGEKS